MCGIAIQVDGERVLSIRGDDDDPFSRGYLCPKAVALQDLHVDPDRLRRPLRRRGTDWEEIGWDEALAEAAERLAAIQIAHGREAVAVYQGNPTVHNYGAVLYAQLLLRSLGTRNRYSATSVDQLWSISPGAMIGPTARVLGDLAMLTGQPEQAVQHYDEAIAFCEKLGAPPLRRSEAFRRRAESAPSRGGDRALQQQLAGAVGLGGRDRRALSDVERTRINVQRRLKDAIARIAAADPSLGRYLGASVKTGTYCAYCPL